MTAAELIQAVRIRDVWRELGGDDPVRGRTRAFYRNGDNPNAVSLNDDKACWHDFVTGEKGGMLSLIQRILGCDRVGALRWLSQFTGLALDGQPFTRAQRRVLADQRERERREIRKAQFFRIAATNMAERVLDELPEDVPDRFGPTQFLLNLRSADGPALLTVYRDFIEREPKLTAALVHAGERAWQRMCVRLARFVVGGAEVRHVA